MTFMRKDIVLGCTVVVISLISLSLFMYMRSSPRFEIARVGVRGNSRLDAQSLVEYLEIQPHTNIFQVQLKDIRQRLEALQWIKSVEVYRNFPNKLSINLVERTPFALLKLDQLYFVDREGVILGVPASGDEIRLPIIAGPFLDNVDREGENPALQKALAAIDDLMHLDDELFQHVRKIQIQSLENATLISYASYPEIRVSFTNYTQNVQRLQRISMELDDETLAYIDLRFEKRVIVMPTS